MGQQTQVLVSPRKLKLALILTHVPPDYYFRTHSSTHRQWCREPFHLARVHGRSPSCGHHRLSPRSPRRLQPAPKRPSEPVTVLLPPAETRPPPPPARCRSRAWPPPPSP